MKTQTQRSLMLSKAAMTHPSSRVSRVPRCSTDVAERTPTPLALADTPVALQSCPAHTASSLSTWPPVPCKAQLRLHAREASLGQASSAPALQWGGGTGCLRSCLPVWIFVCPVPGIPGPQRREETPHLGIREGSRPRAELSGHQKVTDRPEPESLDLCSGDCEE